MRNLHQPDLETRIKAYYDSQQAPAAVRRWVTQAIQEGESGRTVGRRKSVQSFGSRWKWALGGALAAVIAIMILFDPQLWRVTSQPEAESIAGEIALNHKKQLDPEFQTDRYTDLAVAMPKLDFAVIQPGRIQSGGYRLLGGRYCSIGGSLAVQMRLRDQTGRPLTLYQFIAPAGMNLSDQSISVAGVLVDIWLERGVACGLATDEL
ncbi:hypothetical protein MJD09_20205 [bacterium]|nr:hypothetical protein [bacterium]